MPDEHIVLAQIPNSLAAIDWSNQRAKPFIRALKEAKLKAGHPLSEREFREFYEEYHAQQI